MIEDRRVIDQWHLRDLFTDHKTGKLRETLLWSNIGKATAVWGLIYNVVHHTDTEWHWLIVLGVTTAHELLSRYLNQKLPPLPKSMDPSATQTITKE